MVDETLAALAEEALMLRAGILEGAPYQVPVEIGIIFRDSFEQILKSCLFGS